ncbi:MAG: GNAT family N-acetyltransferase [Altibacter sp.]|uniref:GNAT family N-acetyltransferase n=1 Tax=Altibacter lentus TaxID=1223410 RepID=UPI00054E867F|nr:GNAT family N-acetyltransferase [Altibacter lentus]MCW8982064.1 GNAT family N-acetyltransferase [Altibacter sp.]
MEYLIRSQRLGLRNWEQSDLIPFAEMGRDPEVMRYLPKLLSLDESEAFIERMQHHFVTYGYCYFAVDLLETNEFIGFTGLMQQPWESKFTPAVDMGWRLKRSAWGKGYASEAAAVCLHAAFTAFQLDEVYAFAAQGNTASEKVMQKIGMSYAGTFEHPKLANDDRFEYCIAYRKQRSEINAVHA